jgi:hypothetical protein
MASDPNPSSDGADAFARAASEKQPGLIRDFLAFLAQNKKWWLIPILVVLLLAGILVVLGSTALGPLLYPLV